MAPTATPDQQLALLAVQELDTAILQVRRRRADLALTKEVHDLEVEHGSLEMKIVAATTEVSDRTLDVRKAESDVEQVVNRATRDKERMDSGTVSAKELEGLQHELQSLAKRQAELEDVELELMTELEEAQQVLETLGAQRQTVAAQLAESRERLAQALLELDGQETDLATQRAAAVQPVPADVAALYDKLRADMGGIGAAMLHRGACQGCHISLDATEISRIRGLGPDVIVRCEECRRILVRTAESGL